MKSPVTLTILPSHVLETDKAAWILISLAKCLAAGFSFIRTSCWFHQPLQRLFILTALLICERKKQRKNFIPIHMKIVQQDKATNRENYLFNKSC